MKVVFTKPCVRHPEKRGERLARNYACVVCERERKKRWKERQRARRQAERAARKAALRAEQEMMRAAERQARAARKAALRAVNAQKEVARKIEQKKRRKLRARAESDFAYLAARQLLRYERPRATRIELEALWARQRGRCGLTGLLIGPSARPHIDHIVPVARGGSSSVDNLHFVHPMANHAKNSHSVAEFREWLLAAADALRQKMMLEELL